MSAAVQLTCRACGNLIEGDSGWVVVDLDEVLRRERAWRAHDRAHNGACSIATLVGLPGRVEWKAWHRTCDPDVDSNAYYIESGRITTWPEVANWTAHLMEKRWLMSTNWDGVLRQLAANDGTLHGAAA